MEWREREKRYLIAGDFSILSLLCLKFVLNELVVMRPCGLMDKALVFGTKDCRFESCQGHVCDLLKLLCL